MPLQNDSLEYFRAVVDMRSVHAAARSLNIAPSALSRQVRGLERELGVVLFDRTPHGMEPTPEGLLLHDFAVRQSDEMADMRRALRSGAGRGPTEFRIVCVEGVTPRMMPRWLRSLRQKHPNTKFVVTAMGSSSVGAAVAAGDADAGYTFGAVVRTDLRALATLPMPIRLAAREDNPLAKRDNVDMEELAGLTCVLPDANFGIRREVDRECARLGVGLDVAYETNSLSLALRVVQTEGIISFTTASMTVGETSAGIKLIPLSGDRFDRLGITLVARSVSGSAFSSTLRRDLINLMESAKAEV